jgi:O-antigen/teichoic acid export membrane protein
VSALAGLRRSTVVSNALSLFGTTVITSGFGSAFWLLAAHMFDQGAVGTSSAALSAMQLLSIAAMLGLGTLLIGELSAGVERPGRLIATASFSSAVAGLSLGTTFALIAHFAWPGKFQLFGGIAGVALFAATVGLTGVSLVLDDAVVGLSQARWQLWRNALFSLLKLCVLPAAVVIWGSGGGDGLFASWSLGVVVSLGLLVVVSARAGYRLFSRPRLDLVSSYWRSSLTHHWLNLAVAAPRLALPVLVTLFLTPALNASFYTALLLAGFAYVIPSHLSTALFALASGDKEALASELRRTIGVSAVVSVAACLFFAGCSHFLLRMFGAGYVVAAGPLAVLGMGVFATAVKSQYMAVCRVNGDLARCALISCVGSALEVVAPGVGLVLGGGLTIVAASWVVTMVLEAILLWPTVALAAGIRGGTPFRGTWDQRWVAPRTWARPTDYSHPSLTSSVTGSA